MSNQEANNHDAVFCEHCSVSMDRCKYSRRCFMTGEYCSKQQLIQKKRKELHKNRKINAFVVMNFSSMSDVVYNWRIQDFVEDLKKFLRFEVKYDKMTDVQEKEKEKGIVQKLCCFVDDKKAPRDDDPDSQKSDSSKDKNRQGIQYEAVQYIDVIRADSAYASNFVMCNRVCQQMQIADLIIVDVSVENANVFYELGMCMAMGKLILPMCYTNSYFARELPELIRDSNLQLHDLSLSDKGGDAKKRVYNKSGELQNHLGCYPWRKRLFEYYGIRYRNKSIGQKLDDQFDKIPKLPDDMISHLPTNEQAKLRELYAKLSDDVMLHLMTGDKDMLRKDFRDFSAEMLRHSMVDKNGAMLKEFSNLSDKVFKDLIDGKINKHYKGTSPKVSKQLEKLQAIKEFLEFKGKASINIPQYISFEDATNSAYGFDDIHYNKFPYREAHVEEGSFGRKIYERIQKSFNLAGYSDNTLIIYTIDGFENREQAGLCIVNYYKYMTVQLDRYACFCGDRVGTLVQENKIPEDPKDSREEKEVVYNVSEAIHIGVNHATTSAYSVKVNSPKLSELSKNEKEKPEYKDLEKYLQHQSMMIYPEKPVYVRRVRTGVQTDPLSFKPFYAIEKMERFYCLYHVMLRNLKFTKELVVDISSNSPQALFWLGMAHGADVYAITVRREETETERLALTGTKGKRERNLFDVSGLWTAVFQTAHANEFYRQLSLAQMGVEYHSKLMTKSVDDYYKMLLDPINRTPVWNASENKQNAESTEGNKLESYDKLESYYRSKLWRALRKQNRLWLYLCHDYGQMANGVSENNDDPKVFIVKWDVNAAGRLSNYLSKRSPIGEYHIETLEAGKTDGQANQLSFISIGADTTPLEMGSSSDKSDATKINLSPVSLVSDINRQILKKRSIKRKPKSFSGKRKFKKFTTTTKPAKPTLYEKIPVNDTSVGGTCANCTQSQLSNNGLQKKFRGFRRIINIIRYEKDSNTTYHKSIIGNLKDFRKIEEDDKENRKIRLVKEEIPCIMQFPLTGVCVNCKDEYKDKCFKIDNNLLKKVPSGGFGHKQLAQLVLWREIVPAEMGENEDDRKERMEARKKRENYSDAYADDIYYRVALNGVSGPATEALTALLIDPDDSGDIERSNDLLCQLQRQIRKNFLDAYETKIKNFEERGSIYPRIEAYLHGVLYQYALPFLSRREERQILNGLKFYLRSHMEQIRYSEDKKDQFNERIYPYVQALREMLWGFQGVEAFYEVSVSIELEENTNKSSNQSGESEESPHNADGKPGHTKDNRTILGISPHPNSKMVNCIFL